MLFICLTTEFLFLITSANASPLGHFCNCCSACCCFAIPKYNINLTAKGNNVVWMTVVGLRTKFVNDTKVLSTTSKYLLASLATTSTMFWICLAASCSAASIKSVKPIGSWSLGTWPSNVTIYCKPGA